MKIIPGVSVHLIVQRCYDVDLFPHKSDFFVICLILSNILLYYITTIDFVLLHDKQNLWLKNFSLSCLVDIQMYDLFALKKSNKQ